MSRCKNTVAALLVGAVGVGATGCEPPPDPSPPTAEEVASFYSITAPFEVEMNGNVAEIEVIQPWDQLQRGGPLWARVGPYIYLFTPATQEVFEAHPGLAAVRVVTRSPADEEVARALLRRDALNAITWKRALNVSGRARMRGGEKIGLMEALVDWGEEHTDYAYESSYTRRR